MIAMKPVARFIAWLVLLALITHPVIGRSQQPDTVDTNHAAAVFQAAESTTTASAAESLQRQRAGLAKRLETVRSKHATTTVEETADGETIRRLAREIDLLQQLDLVLGQRQVANDHTEQLQAKRDCLLLELEALQSEQHTNTTASSLLVLDLLRDQHSDVSTNLLTSRATTSATSVAVEASVKVREQRERDTRSAKEKLAGATHTATARNLKTALGLAQLETQLANELVLLRQAEQQHGRLNEEILELQKELLGGNISRLENTVQFSDRHLQDQIVEFEHQEQLLQSEIEAAQLELTYIEREWFDARQQLSRDEDPTASSGQVDSWRLGRETRQQSLALINQRLQRIGSAKTTWRRRYEIFHDRPEQADRDRWRNEAEQAVENLVREDRLQTLRIAQLRKDMATLDTQLHTARTESPGTIRWLKQRQTYWQSLIQEYDTNLVSIETSRRLHEKLEHEISSFVRLTSIGEWVAGKWGQVLRIWSYEVTSVDDHPITFGKLVTGLFLLVIGFVLSRQISWFFGRRLLPRMGMHIRAAAAIQSIMFYVLVTTFTLAALKLVAVPLTVFTLVGGALAIGFGLGSQNAITNFISGLILLADRPIRVHDTVELEGVYGTVERIGVRSTRLKTPDNLEIIVPNSAFLQNNVVNLTLSDNTIRTFVSVGVAYGTATKETEQLLLQAANEHERVFDHPTPVAWFVNFGDNSLSFEVHFWIRILSIHDKQQVESDIRHRIDQLFAQAGIVIAFPQRDLHLDTASPLEIRLSKSLRATG
jgi:small-conductance mechanosensitive channel